MKANCNDYITFRHERYTLAYESLRRVTKTNESTNLQSTYKRPSYSVHHKTWLMFGWINLPYLFNTQTVWHWLAVLTQIKLLKYLFREVSMATFSKYSHLSVKLHSSLKVFLWFIKVIYSMYSCELFYKY